METKKHGIARNTPGYGDPDFALYLRRSFYKSLGLSQAMLDRPIIGIVDTGSGFNNCHRTAPELIEAVKRGVLAAGGLPMAFPTVSLSEPSLFPTSMHFRNLAALDTEAMLAAQPMDAAVMVGGCDKSVPAQLMGAASSDVPSIQLVTGPMLASPYQGERLAACTDCRRYWAGYRAGTVTGERIAEIVQEMRAITFEAHKAEAIGVAPGSLGLQISRRYYGSGHRLLEYAIQSHPADSFVYRVTLKSSD